MLEFCVVDGRLSRHDLVIGGTVSVQMSHLQGGTTFRNKLRPIVDEDIELGGKVAKFKFSEDSTRGIRKDLKSRQSLLPIDDIPLLDSAYFGFLSLEYNCSQKVVWVQVWLGNPEFGNSTNVSPQRFPLFSFLPDIRALKKRDHKMLGHVEQAKRCLLKCLHGVIIAGQADKVFAPPRTPCKREMSDSPHICQAIAMREHSAEIDRRLALIDALADKFAQDAVLTSEQLGSFDFGFGPERIKANQKGIWNPKDYAATLTIVSDPAGQYDDGDHGDSLYRYSYERQPAGRDPRGGSNVKLRAAMELQLPIIMLRKIGPGQYVPIMPVYVVADEPENQRFILALDESLRFIKDPTHLTQDERRYADRVVKQRMHQPEFRAKVLRAYETKCTVCELKRAPLLDAAHITADSDELGLPVVSNGLSLCKIHHAAYDENILGISPDYVVHINKAVLLEVDGPMLKHGLQEMNARKIWLPKRASEQPDRDRLATKFEKFQNAG